MARQRPEAARTPSMSGIVLSGWSSSGSWADVAGVAVEEA